MSVSGECEDRQFDQSLLTQNKKKLSSQSFFLGAEVALKNLTIETGFIKKQERGRNKIEVYTERKKA